MANVIKHKRGSGSDPVASDLVVGEVAIRTDVGKLFTKMDNGSVAEIAGGGSDIAINTLSSSSGTGGGSATFNGSAFRFTLSSPPSVSAQQLLVSINGVIQKPVAGTGQPSEGFSVDGTDIILGDAPATGSDFFILTFKSLGVSEPADNSVTSAKIADGAIVNADINASAAIAGSKIADFVTNNANNRVLTASGTANSLIGEDNLTFTGSILTVTNSSGAAELTLVTPNNTDSGVYFNDGSNSGAISYQHSDDSMRFRVNATEKMRINSSGNVGIGTTSPSGGKLHIVGSGNTGLKVQVGSSSNDQIYLGNTGGASSVGTLTNVGFNLIQNGGVALAVNTDKNVGIGTTSPSSIFHVQRSGGTEFRFDNLYFYIKSPDGGNRYFFGETQNDKSAQLSLYNSSNTQKVRIAAGDGTGDGATFFNGGNVGIGTTSPTSTLFVNGTSSSHIFTARSADTNGNCIINLLSEGTTGNSRILFSDTAQSDGIITFSHNDRALIFGTVGTAEDMRIDSSGRLLIGSTDGATHANSSTDDLIVGSSANGKNDGITILSGTAQNGTVAFADSGGSTQGLVGYVHNGDYLRFHAGDTLKVRIDTDGLKFNSDTAAANALDDYEEGTFTPQFAGVGGGPTSITFGTTNGGSYVKIGNLVYVAGRSDITASSGGSQHWLITNMPFVNKSGTKQHNAIGHVYLENFSIPDNVIDTFGALEQGINNLIFTGTRKDNTYTNGISHGADQVYSVQFSICYRTD